MKTKSIRIISILILVFLFLSILTLIAGAIAKSNLAKQYPAPGQLVDVGGYKMHINCLGESGAGSPTVILEAGQSDYSLIWAAVQPEVAKTIRVCSYDRAGYGWSERSPHPRTANVEVEELHTLLVNAHVQGPYLLAGHSLGGMLMLLVDSFHEERPIRNPEVTKLNQDAAGQLRMFSSLSSIGLMALSPQSIPNRGFPEDAYLQYQALTATTDYFDTWLAESLAVPESAAEARALHMTGFGSLPIIVLSAGLWDEIPSLSDAENQQLWEDFQVQQFELVALSSVSKQIIAEQSSHHIQLDQPDLVIDAVEVMVKKLQE